MKSNILNRLTDKTNIPIILAMLLLVGNFYVVAISRSPMISQMGADEDAWVLNARKSWEAKRGSVIAHVPLFHDMVMPFVAGVLVDPETGFAIWKVSLVFLSQVLLFLFLKRISNCWIAFILTLHFQFLTLPWFGPTYTYLAMVFYLLSMIIILRRKNLIGVSVGLLLLGCLVRFELTFLLLAFLVLLFVFSRRSIIWSKAARQLAIPVCLFVGLIYWHGSSIQKFPQQYLARGNVAVVWNIVDHLYRHGYFAKYTDAGRGQLTDALQDSVLLEQFGQTKEELSHSSLLDMFRRNPEIMKARYKEWLHELPSNLNGLFTISVPYAELLQRKVSWWHILILILAPPVLYSVSKRRVRGRSPSEAADVYGQENELNSDSAMRPFLILTISSLACFIPWLMTSPQAHYLIIIVPAFYAATAMLWSYLESKFINLLARWYRPLGSTN